MGYYYSYMEFRADLISLTKKIDRSFDAIVGISRGGLSMAQMLGEYYDKREIYTINSIAYKGIHKLDSIQIFNLPDLSGLESILLVDDIVDSGHTLIKILEILKDRYPTLIVYIASIFYKKSAKMAPNWFVKEPDEWIDFFWSVDLRENRR